MSSLPIANTDTPTAIRTAILANLPDADVEITGGGGGHFSLVVKSSAFDGKSMLESHRLVLTSIADLMAGDRAPVHAVDSLRTLKR